jgi:hypothetical protein
LCLIKKPRERGHNPRWAAEPERGIIIIIIITIRGSVGLKIAFTFLLNAVKLGVFVVWWVRIVG